MSRDLLGYLSLSVCLALATACNNNSYASAAVSGQTGDPAAILDFTSGISIPEGSAASAHVDLMSHSNQTLTGGNIQSADTTVLRVVHTATDSSGYVFLGVSAGTTTVNVSVNGQQVQTVSAIVAAPPPSSVPPTLDAGVQPVTPLDAGGPDGDAGGAPD
jgi:hypothetical protein